MGYEGLLELLRSCAQEYQESLESEATDPQACPNDGEPLRDGPDGYLYCPFDGWRPEGAPVR